MRRAGLVAALLAVSVAASASDNPAKVAIAPGSADAAVIVRAPSRDVEYRLVLTPYDAATGTTMVSQRGSYYLTIKPFREQERYWVKRLPAGRYVVNRIDQQRQWASCFHAATLEFEVRAGELLHLGAFDSDSALAKLRADAVANDQTKARTHQGFTYFKEIAAPRFAAPDAAELAATAAFVRQAMPRTLAVPRQAILRPAHFRLGRNVASEAECGGDYAKPPPA